MKEKRSKNLLIFLSANLIARSLAPVIRRLTDDKKINIKIINDNYGTSVINQLGFHYQIVTPPFHESLNDFVNEADVVFSGKTYIREAENVLMELCEKKGVPYVILLPESGGEIAYVKFKKRKPDNSPLLPTYIFVADLLTHSYLIKKGIPKDMLLPGGNPYFDSLMSRASIAPKTSENVSPVITYMDCPFEWDFENNLLPAGPYAHKRLVDEVIQAIPQGVDLQIRLHPRSDEKHFDLAKEKRIPFVDDIDSFTTILNSDVVISTYSTTLLEASLAGVQAISYQPWDSEKVRSDLFKVNIPIASNQLSLKKYIKRALKHFRAPRKKSQDFLYNSGESTDVIVDFLYKILEID